MHLFLTLCIFTSRIFVRTHFFPSFGAGVQCGTLVSGGLFPIQRQLPLTMEIDQSFVLSTKSSHLFRGCSDGCLYYFPFSRHLQILLMSTLILVHWSFRILIRMTVSNSLYNRYKRQMEKWKLYILRSVFSRVHFYFLKFVLCCPIWELCLSIQNGQFVWRYNSLVSRYFWYVPSFWFVSWL